MAGAQLLSRQLNSPWRRNFIATPCTRSAQKSRCPGVSRGLYANPVLASRQAPFQGSASGGESLNSGQSARLTGKQQLRPGGRRPRVRCSHAAISTACFVGTQKTQRSNRITNGSAFRFHEGDDGRSYWFLKRISIQHNHAKLPQLFLR